MPGYLLDLHAVNKMIENTKTSTMPEREGE